METCENQIPNLTPERIVEMSMAAITARATDKAHSGSYPEFSGHDLAMIGNSWRFLGEETKTLIVSAFPEIAAYILAVSDVIKREI